MKLSYFLFLLLIYTEDDGWRLFRKNEVQRSIFDLSPPLYITQFTSRSFIYYFFAICLILTTMAIQAPYGKTKAFQKNVAAASGIFLFSNHLIGMYLFKILTWSISIVIWFVVFFLFQVKPFKHIIQNSMLSIASAYTHVYLSMVFFEINTKIYFYLLLIVAFIISMVLGFLIESLQVVLVKCGVCTLIFAILVDFFLPISIFLAMHGEAWFFARTTIFISKLIIVFSYIGYLINGLFG